MYSACGPIADAPVGTLVALNSQSPVKASYAIQVNGEGGPKKLKPPAVAINSGGYTPCWLGLPGGISYVSPNDGAGTSDRDQISSPVRRSTQSTGPVGPPPNPPAPENPNTLV